MPFIKSGSDEAFDKNRHEKYHKCEREGKFSKKKCRQISVAAAFSNKRRHGKSSGRGLKSKRSVAGRR